MSANFYLRLNEFIILHIVKIINTYSSEATLMRALVSSMGQSSCCNEVLGNNILSSSSNGIVSSTTSLRQHPWREEKLRFQGEYKTVADENPNNVIRKMY